MLIENLEKLAHFKAVAEEGSFLAGGRRVNQAQQSVYYSVNRLEAALGVQLFSRSRKGVKLTKEGMFLLERTRQIETLTRDTERVLSQMKIQPFKIRLGINLMRFSSLIAPTFQKLQQLGGGLQVEPVIVESAIQLVESVQNGDIDLAIVAEPTLESSSSIVAISLFKEEYQFFKSTSWTLNSPRKISNCLIESEKILYLPRSVSANQPSLNEELKEMGFPDSHLNLPSFEAIKQLVLNNRFIGLLPKSLVSIDDLQGRLEKVSVPRSLSPEPFHIKLVYNADTSLRKTAVEIKKIIVSMN